MNTLKSLFLSLTLLSTGIIKANDGDNNLLPNKNKILIESSAAHDGLIIKSTTNCNVQILDECGMPVIDQKVEKGTNRLTLKNMKSARYKIVVTDGAFQVVRNLSVR